MILGLLLGFALGLALSAAPAPAGAAGIEAGGPGLILHSYHRAAWTEEIMRGVESVLGNRPGLELTVEYMDTKRYSDEAYLTRLKEVYAHKFESTKPRLVLTSDDNAFHFALDHQAEIFGGAPIVFCGVNRFADRLLAGQPEVTGVVERGDFEETLEYVFRARPRTKTIHLICDETKTGRINREAFEELMARRYPRVAVAPTVAMDLARLEATLTRTGPDSVAFFISFWRDGTGRQVTPEDLEKIFRRASAPIFGRSEWMVGRGLTGGKCVRGFNQGRAAAQLAARILDGQRASTIPVIKNSPNQFMFDHRLLVRHGLDPDGLPPQALVVNQPVPFYRVSKNVAVMLLASLGALACLVVILIVTARQRSRALADLAESEDRFRSVADFTYNWEQWRGTDGNFIYVSPACERISGHGPAEFLANPLLMRDLAHPDDRHILDDHLQVCHSDRSGTTQVEFRIIAKDGRTKWLSHTCHPVFGPDGEWRGRRGSNLEITARKRAEEALRGSEARYRRLVERSPLGIMSIDRTGRVVDLNPKTAEIFGSPSIEATRRINILEFPLLVEAGVAADFKRCLKTGESSISDRAYTSKWGKAVHLRYHLEPLHGPEGEVEGVQAVIEDFTHRMAAEEKLRRSEKRFRESIELSPIPMVRVVPGVGFDFVNRKFTEVLGYTLEDLPDLDTFWEKAYPDPEYRRFVQQDWTRAISRIGPGENEIRGGEYRLTCKNGTVKTVEVFGSRIGPNRLIIYNDVTARREAEERLARTQSLLTAAIDQSPAGILIADAGDLSIRVANSKALEILGAEEEYLQYHLTNTEKRPWKVFHPDGSPAPTREYTLSRAIREGRTFSGLEWMIRRADGSLVWTSATAAPIRNDEGEIVSGILLFLDITAQKQAEAQQGQLESQLRQAQKMEAVGTLAGGIAHDFNNILQAIGGYVHLLAAKEAVRPEGRGYLDRIEEATLRASDLVRRLLTFSRKVEPSLRPINLNQEIARGVDLLKRTLPKMIDIATELTPGMGLINGDGTQLEQVLLNLGGNAGDAMPQGGRLTISTALVFLDEEFQRNHPTARQGDHIRLRIADTGVGMDKDTRKNIFDPFYTTKERGKGTGLGLAMVYGIVKAHQGYITCRSEPGRGTTFDLYWPLLGSPPEEPGREPETVEEPAPKGERERILLVDDEPPILEVAQELLENHGYRIETAANGEEALDLYARDPARYELVIMDLGMPGMGGHQALVRMIELDPAAKVMIASGYSSEAQVKAALADGATEFIGKPYRLTDMLRKVRQVLDQ